MDLNNQNITIYTCQFAAFVEKAKVQIKFPCNYFLQWKANNGKVIVSSKNRFQAVKSEISFSETLNINVNLLFDRQNKKYFKKQSLLMINLISKSRPDQIKLVGRTPIDLAEVLNTKSFQQLTTTQLQYCSVDASINFRVKCLSVKQSTMSLSELDRSSFNEYMSFQSHIKPFHQLVHRHEGSSTHRDFDEVGSRASEERGEIRSLGRDKNRMSSSSLTKQSYTPVNRPSIKNQLINNQPQLKLSRSNSISNENTNKMASSRERKQTVQQQSSFSFQRNIQESNCKKPTPSPFQQNPVSIPPLQIETLSQNKSKKTIQSVPSKQQLFKPQPESARSSRFNFQKIKNQPKQVKKLELQEIKRSIKFPPESKTKQQYNERAKVQQQHIEERENIIKCLEQQIESKRQSIPFVALVPIETSFSLQTRTNHAKRHTVQLEKSHSQSKRIIGLTETLNQLEGKYTQLTFETEELRNNWKKEKDEFLNTISRQQMIINAKDREVRDKAKLNEVLQSNIIQIEKTSNERFADLASLKSQLAELQKERQKLIEQKQKHEVQIGKLQNEIKSLTEQTMQSKDELSKTFADRLTMQQQRNIELQNSLQQFKKQKVEFQKQMQEQKGIQEKLKLRIDQLQKQNKTYSLQLQNVHNELFTLKQENEKLRDEFLQRQKDIREERERVWFSKDEEITHLLRDKDREVDKLKEDSEIKLAKATEKYQRENQRLNSLYQQLQSKMETLQNTTLSQNEQISDYHNSISQLTSQLEDKKQQLDDMIKLNETLSLQQKQNLGEHQQILLRMNNQLEQRQSLVKSLQQQIQKLKQTLDQRDIQLIQHQQSYQSTKHQLQVTKAQSTIYENKIIELNEVYEKQVQHLKLACSQQVYELQIILQQQFEKYNQLQHINLMLKQALEEWQNKCTEDRIASSKAVSKLNEILRDKEETMYEMENIMRTLERDKFTMHQTLLSQQKEFSEITKCYKTKHQQMKAFLEIQETEFLSLYQSVNDQRASLNQLIQNKQQLITELESKLQQSTLINNQLSKSIESIKTQLGVAETSLIELSAQSQQKLKSLNDEHNQEIDEYEERIRELQNVISQKDAELVQKQMVIFDLDKLNQELKSQLEEKSQQAAQALEAEIDLKGQLQRLENEKNQIIAEKQKFLMSLDEESQRYNQLQNSMIEVEERMGNRIHEVQKQKAELSAKITKLQEDLCLYVQNIRNIQQTHNSLLQSTKSQYQLNIEQLKRTSQSQVKQLSSRISLLQEQILGQDQIITQKSSQIKALTQEKDKLSSELDQLKLQRQIIALINFKEHTDKLKSQIKVLVEENLQLKNQMKQIPALQRALKIKTIEVNCLKYNTSINPTSVNSEEQMANVQEIIKLKNQEIDLLKQENQKMKDLELQIFQVETLNQDLCHDIEQYEEEKFNYTSELNEKKITISELQQEVKTLMMSKNDLKEKNHELIDKLKYYESLILDYKGHEPTSSKSQSQKLNHSWVSSSKIINAAMDVELQNNYKLQIQTFVKKIKLLESELNKSKTKEEEYIQSQNQYAAKLQEYQNKIAEAECTIKQKEAELAKKINSNNTKLVNQSQKPIIQYRNPQHVGTTFKQIQGLLKKRAQFHALEKTLQKLYEIEVVQSMEIIKDDQGKLDEKNKMVNLSKVVSTLSIQFQNIKGRIMKLEGKNYQQKARYISLIRPIEEGIRQIMKYTGGEQ